MPRLFQAADLRLFRWVAATHHPLGDAVLPRLSRAANRSVVWMTIATGLGLFGGRHGKRAALRGLLGIACTSFLTNVPAKLMFRRSRPQFEVPLTRRLARVPTSTSFPSGHSASAFAFATGLSIENPTAGSAVFPLAGAVAYSRVYTGVHYPSDVIVGALIGAGFAWATRAFWPPLPSAPARTGPAARVSPSLIGPDGDGLAVVVNTAAGGPLTGDTAAAIAEALPGARIAEIETGSEMPAALVDMAATARVLGVAGGDGSVNAAAAVALERGLPLLVIPAGTLNHFASDLGIESLDDALRGLRAGAVAEVEVSFMDGNVFLNTASLGAYVDMVEVRSRMEDTIGKWPAVLLALIHILRTGDPVRLVIDGEPVEAWLVFFGNGKFHPEGFAPSWRSRLDEGVLDVRIVDATHPFARARLVWAVFTGTLTKSTVYRALTTDRPVHIRSLQGPLPVSRDGETFEGASDFTVEKAESPLLVVVPDVEAES